MRSNDYSPMRIFIHSGRPASIFFREAWHGEAGALGARIHACGATSPTGRACDDSDALFRPVRHRARAAAGKAEALLLVARRAYGGRRPGSRAGDAPPRASAALARRAAGLARGVLARRREERLLRIL